MEPGDQELVRRLRRGDRGAFEALYHRHRRRLFQHALVQTGGRRAIAEEVVQDVFLSLFEGRARPRHNVAAYLLVAVRRRALNACQRREDRADQVDPALAGSLIAESTAGAAPDVVAHQREEARVLAEALLTLEPDQREVVLLRAFEGLAWKEVAALTGVAIATAASRYSAALQRLRLSCRSLSHA